MRPVIKRQKNDAADAEAIVIAARQPEMRWVTPKTAEQPSRAAVFRGRERPVHQRTADVNALHALLHAQGHVFPLGLRPLDRIPARVEDETFGRPAAIGLEGHHLLAQSGAKTARIAERPGSILPEARSVRGA